MSGKIDHIYACTTALLQDAGSEGLSMRKVAQKTSMSLSNVQYYFKTKELLLAGLLKSFLEEYTETFKQYTPNADNEPEENIRLLLIDVLDNSETTDCAFLFKELWVIAQRNPGVGKAMEDYYENMFTIIETMLKKTIPGATDPRAIKQAASILMPFMEGYCIARSTLPVDPSALAGQMASVIMYILNKTDFRPPTPLAV